MTTCNEDNKWYICLYKPLIQNFFTCSEQDVIKIRNDEGSRKAMTAFLTQPLEVQSPRPLTSGVRGMGMGNAGLHPRRCIVNVVQTVGKTNFLAL